MSTLSHHFMIEAPADAVWDVIGRRFDRIGDWATAIPMSTAVGHPTGDAAPAGRRAPSGIVDAPVAGRVCHTGVRLLPQVTETLTAYDDAARTLTYQASGLPRFVTTARNTWTVTPLGQRRTRVTLKARFDTRGLLGVLAGRAILLQVAQTSRHLADDLTHYIEHGEPSPRKQRQLHRARQ